MNIKFVDHVYILTDYFISCTSIPLYYLVTSSSLSQNISVSVVDRRRPGRPRFSIPGSVFDSFSKRALRQQWAPYLLLILYRQLFSVDKVVGA
jgi:hypothetical protein